MNSISLRALSGEQIDTPWNSSPPYQAISKGIRLVDHRDLPIGSDSYARQKATIGHFKPGLAEKQRNHPPEPVPRPLFSKSWIRMYYLTAAARAVLLLRKRGIVFRPVRERRCVPQLASGKGQRVSVIPEPDMPEQPGFMRSLVSSEPSVPMQSAFMMSRGHYPEQFYFRPKLNFSLLCNGMPNKQN